jgi:hypothetical protein
MISELCTWEKEKRDREKRNNSQRLKPRGDTYRSRNATKTRESSAIRTVHLLDLLNLLLPENLQLLLLYVLIMKLRLHLLLLLLQRLRNGEPKTLIKTE